MCSELAILYQDEYLVVVNKPAGMLVHRGERDSENRPILLQTLREQLGQRVYPVHRLDRMTSGAITLALNSETASLMVEQWRVRTVEKRYLAVVRGYMPDEVHLDYAMAPPIDKFKKNPKPKPVQEAITDFYCLGQVEIPVEIDKYPQSRYSLIEALPKTGRKHQIRRHLKHLSHPIIGDTRYGKGKHTQYFRDHMACNQMLLHAWQLSFQHPYSKQTLSLTAPLNHTWWSIVQTFGWTEVIPQALVGHR
ncbi:pseudouridine synthase [Litoribrevibacter albus]|uniref:tRNA pseudouridine synthase C n=1 Tax=Litoribrevibacter albus TaxID=1473156 RepID=A0AA37SD45_9GAMM|nr:pseudouridine synthase [Litoribrevibacter albus]GLQ32267.1 tRNA pseudouridine synthase C [Litoribrevibacter albus]